MSPMKKIFSVLLAVVLICTMVTWPAAPVKADEINPVIQPPKIKTVEISNYSQLKSEITKFELDTFWEGCEFIIENDIYFPYQIDIGLFSTSKTKKIVFKGKDGKPKTFYAGVQGRRLFGLYGIGVTVDFNGFSIFGFTNPNEGGAIYAKAGTIKGGNFYNCMALTEGGAIYVDKSDDGNVNISDCKFFNCSSKEDGGAVYINGDNTYVLTCDFENCQSTSNDGGAIFVYGNLCEINRCNFRRCKAEGNGGAVKLSMAPTRGPLFLKECRFFDCTAGSSGKWVHGGNDTYVRHCTRPYGEPEYYRVKYDDFAIPGCQETTLTQAIGVEPTCTSAGLKTYYECNCGLFYSDRIPSTRTLIGTFLNSRTALEEWKKTPGLGYLPAKGHDFRFETKQGVEYPNPWDRDVLIKCIHDEDEHRVALDLAVRNTTYSGKAQNAQISGNINHADWKKYGVDYDFYYRDYRGTRLMGAPVDAGTYKAIIEVEIRERAWHKLTETRPIIKSFTIDQKPITAEFVSFEKGATVLATGKEITNNVIVKDGDKVLKEGKDYNVKSDSKITGKDKGSYNVTVEGIGNYKGTVTEKWYIVEKELEVVTPPTASDIEYGQPLSKSNLDGYLVVEKGNKDANVSGSFHWEDPKIVPDEAGTKTYTAEFIPNIKSAGFDNPYGILEVKVPVKINQKNLTKADVVTSVPTTYTGSELKDFITLNLDKASSLGLMKGIDYDVTSPTSVIDPGKYTAVYTLKGNYSGTITEEFTITRTVGKEDIDLIVPAYTGEVLNDSIDVWLDRKEIKRGTDYDIRFSPAEVKERGEYTAFITLKGDYIKGKVEIKFSVDGEKRGPRPAPSPTPTPDPSPSPSPDDGGGYSGGGYSGGSSGGSLSIPAVTTQNGTANKPNTEEPFEEIDLLELLYAHPDAGKALPLIRMYNPVSGEHIMTTDANEADTLEAKHGWKREAMTGTSSKANDSPVFRLFHPATGKHIYSMNENEVRVLTTEQGWESDGIVFFAGGSNVKMYRLYNPSLPAAIAHHYTTDEGEYNTLQSQGWTGEGVAFTLD